MGVGESFLCGKWASTDRGNHKNIFADAGVEWKEYQYFDKQTIGLDFKGMTSDLEAAPDGSIVVLHGTPLEMRVNTGSLQALLKGTLLCAGWKGTRKVLQSGVRADKTLINYVALHVPLPCPPVRCVVLKALCKV